jgi:hypothetical protein
VRYSEEHALNVAVPSAVLMAEELFPLETGGSKGRLIRLITDYIVTTIHAYVEFAPPQPVPEPSAN